MKRVLLNNTDLYVSPLSIGTVNYGSSIDSKDAKAQLDRFVELGGNFIDTAHVYGDWVPGPRGRSEKVIGEWLKETGLRKDVVISTKGAHPDISDTSISRVNPEAIEKDLNESLERLNTDYTDLYFLHRDNPDVPVGEVLDALEEARIAGKIRYYGCSNWSISRISEASEYARKQNISGFVCNQLMWSLADVNYNGIEDKTLVLMDRDTYEHHKKTCLTFLMISPFLNINPSPLPPAIPISALLASPGPLTAHPIMATLMFLFRFPNRSSTSLAILTKSIWVLPHVGHEMNSIPPSKSPRDFKISFPTTTSSTGSPVSDTLKVSPIPIARRAPIPTLDFIVPLFTVPDSVTPI
jgi:predicted oxidoreductase